MSVRAFRVPRNLNSGVSIPISQRVYNKPVPSFLLVQTLYDATFIAVYNVIYTSLPVIALAILDQVSLRSLSHPNPKP